MKRFIFIIFLMAITAVISWKCDIGEEQKEADSQAAAVFVQHYYTGRRAPTWERIYIPSILVYGDLIGDPLPVIDYVQVANRKFSDPANFYYYEGGVHFTTYNRIWSDSIPEPKFAPVTVKIQTDLGEIEGSITVPDTIEMLTISAADTIPLGTSVTISWTGSDADYYYVYFFHNWLEDFGYWLGYSVDTVVTTHSVTFDGSRFLKDGDISEFEVCPVNGPLPVAGAEPNMEGDGYGYLYLENATKSSDRFIVIGDGIDYSIFEKPVKPVVQQENLSVTLQQKIKERLGL
jgi:hypothetical protein